MGGQLTGWRPFRFTTGGFSRFHGGGRRGGAPARPAGALAKRVAADANEALEGIRWRLIRAVRFLPPWAWPAMRQERLAPARAVPSNRLALIEFSAPAHFGMSPTYGPAQWRDFVAAT